jgi:hypothetical protein
MGSFSGRLTFRFLFLIVIFFLWNTSPVWAHAFGIRYDLPLPLWLYVSGAGAAVALSFVIMALFLKEQSEHISDLRFDLLLWPPFYWLKVPLFIEAVRLFAFTAFLFLLVAGLWGNSDPFKNFTPTFIWVVWWVGMAFFSSLVGNIWDLINPWKAAGFWAAKVSRKNVRAYPYPSWLGQWPALFLFLCFAWMELISELAEQPKILALIIILYSVITWFGMACFGRDIWLKSGEIFTVAFSLLARFAPSYGDKEHLWIRLPAVGLLCSRPAHISMTCFVLLLLTTVTFDGLLETPSWAAILTWVSESQTLRPFLISLQDAGINLITLIKTIALLIFPMIFIAVFFITCKAITLVVGSNIKVIDIAGYFVLSLVPIAIAYHLSHYLSYLLIAGQNIIPLASDPFGIGWDLFGTAGYAVDIGIVNAKMIWYVSVTAIVVGHVMAVYVAHVMAIRIFKDTHTALLSQLPMLILMVGYTMISLWILSQPIIS